MRKSEWVRGLTYVCLLAVLPFAGHWARDGRASSCAYDGGKIEPLYRVRVVDGAGGSFEFCCIDCTENWLRSKSKKSGDLSSAIFVVDEVSGAEIDAASAYFVRSLAVTNRTTGNRIHAFRNKTDAETHARSPGGHLLDPAEGPFANRCCSVCPDCVSK